MMMITSITVIIIPSLPESPNCDIPDITFYARGIQKQLESIRPGKACGPDQIPARVLKESVSELASILASLFQQAFANGTLPSAWKEANITAIFNLKRGIPLIPRTIDLCH